MINKWVIDETGVGIRLDKFLSEENEEQSRSAWQKRIDCGEIKVNGNVEKSNYKVKSGDEIQWEAVETAKDIIYPVDMGLQVIYEDDFLAVINKPSGISMHPGSGAKEETLAHGLLHRFKKLSKVSGEDRPGIVHRLDKETAGILIIAKDDITHEIIKDSFSRREVYKSYYAIVHGKYKESKSIVEPIGRHPVHRTKMAVVNDGRKAITEVFPVEDLGNYTLVKVDIITGRTHQIRVHLAYDNHPVVGDSVYGPKKTHSKFLMLAATTVGIKHPHTGEYLSFKTELPEHMQSFIRKNSKR
ncbi:MAG: RluA family pseudouridine synthase [Tissierellia bacterium]|nr:RluA family pseudouridine synthase [Tissierellia bacterium]